MNDVLLTVSGRIPPDLVEKTAQGQRPTADYVAMAEAFSADLLDYDKALEVVGKVGRWLSKYVGLNIILAFACWKLRHRYRVIFTDGEQIGLPLAFMLKFFRLNPFFQHRARHLMLVHIISVAKKQKMVDLFALHTHIDCFFVYATWQKSFIEQRWGVPSERVVLTPFMVDANFFAPKQATGEIKKQLGLENQTRPIISAVGLEFRDYPTLLKAVDGLDVTLIIAAGSPWSKRTDSTEGKTIPDNVIVQRFSQHQLRDVYAISDFVTMPLYNVNFQAGVTAILEAMAMERAVICTSTPGQTDVIIHDESGYYVPPEDAYTWRLAIQHLLSHPEESKRMGKLARKHIVEQMSLDCYTKRLNWYVKKYVANDMTTGQLSREI